jgi:endonuclease-3
MLLKERYHRVIRYFEKEMPVAEMELRYHNPFQLLVAVILSAQCTDKRVNMVTPLLFEAFPDAETMAAAGPEDIFPFIKSISYPNNKAKHLAAMAKKLIETFNGKVPETVEQLQSLPGVGRKTANVVASVVYNKATMPVDTHIFRVSARLGLTKNAKTPLVAEMQLVKHIPENLISKAHHWLILHGRYICIARKPKCHVCPFIDFCLYIKKKKQNS